MEFSLSPGQIDACKQTIAFVQTQINPLLDANPSPENFNRDLWRQCAQAGFLKLAVPDAWLANAVSTSNNCASTHAAILANNNYLNQSIVLEAFGYACEDSGYPFALTAHGSTVQQTLLQHGSAEQQNRYLPASIAGELIGAHAMTETQAGSDAAAIGMYAEKTDNGYIISGKKRMITLAPVADFFILFTTVNPAAGRWGLTAFLIDRNAAGVSVSAPDPKLGLDSVPIGRICLDQCQVTESQRLGPEGAGAAIAQHSLELERSTILASQVGKMRRQLEVALRHARDRKQFGQAIAEFQSVSNRLADMRLRLETAQLLMYKTAWMRDQGKSTQLESSMLKLLISEHFLASSMDAMRIHGGYAYLDNHSAGRDTRDALGGIIYAGTSDIQRNIIAGLLDLHAGQRQR